MKNGDEPVKKGDSRIFLLQAGAVLCGFFVCTFYFGPALKGQSRGGKILGPAACFNRAELN
jgi:hypothetical protein